MDLLSGKMYWPDIQPQNESYPALQADVHCDIVIVGGGISGALTAFELAKRGYHVAVLEKREVGKGSTCANTGLLQFSNDKPLTSCIQSYGEHRGVRFYELCKQAAEKLIALKDELLTDPHLYPRSSIYYASTEKDLPELKQEYETLRKYGFPAEWIDTEEIKDMFGFTKPGALLTHGDAEVDPYRFIHSLLHTAERRYGLKIYEHTEVSHHEVHEDEIAVFTKSGYEVRANYAIYAMGYETQEMKQDRNAVLNSTYAIVTGPIPGIDETWKDRMLIWETARPYLYMRTTPDNRIIAGGLDETTTNPEARDRKLADKTRLLEQEVEKLFPSLGPIKAEYAWAAVFGSTRDGYPIIGEHPDYPRCFFIEGYGGNGTIYSTIASELIPALLKQGDHPDAELFRFCRNLKS